ncbi:succinyl-diaminopimelate desuccinylase [Aureimonas mangrovi]|uniref:succinyl-diaminopimelate desuccinylase n=1 Tax=Aureimonas mangrovi TaxID=2758041 RepID=UPI00163DB9FB|nr:succinyl-diaminopimelate desuccinylase [Aureimonas mangrovi]
MTALPIDPAANLKTLIRCPSVTPAEGGALSALAEMLAPLGFSIERPVFSAPGTPDVENLLARRGEAGPHLVFAGHTDVVPPGDEADWRHPPFSGAEERNEIYGRGAVDMKGGIACFVAALARLHAAGKLPAGRVSLLITGDEEGPAINGTVRLLDFAAARGERYDACVVGEPTNPETIGDMVKIGRRGSLSGVVTVTGRQGHVAYPQRALNPMRVLGPVLAALQDEPLDAGSADFQPSNLEVTSVDTGNAATNVIPARCTLAFNVRFNDRWDASRLRAELEERVARAIASQPGGFDAAFAWRSPSSDVFLTMQGPLTDALSQAIEDVTGKRPELSTSGGTSDARFIKDHCPVVEFGLVGQTMHMANERVSLADLETLTVVYEAFITRWFAAYA